VRSEHSQFDVFAWEKKQMIKPIDASSENI